MGATVEIFNNDQRVAKTSRAFDCHTVHELMRMYTLSFSITNKDAARKYIIPGATFIFEGQAYDISNFKKESGSSNVTSISANHVAYRLLNYSIQPGYAFVGTVAQIAADMLNVAVDKDGNKANTEFQIGTTPDLGTKSFSLNNTDVVTAKYAIMALKNIGAESDFDNFTINFAQQIGGGQTQAVEFGVNMADVTITYDKSNGTTYEIDLADLQIINPQDHPFDIGWYAHVKDSTTGEEFTKRIINYDRCWDDPTQDKITLGVFVSDISTETAQMSIDIDTAQSTANDAQGKANNSVQIGTSYNNVDISHTYGFRSSSSDGNMRILSNGTDGFVIQHNVNNSWVTIWQADSASGKTIAYNLEHSQKVEMGGDYGYTTWVSSNHGSTWTQTGGQGPDGGVQATKLIPSDNSGIRVDIGSVPLGDADYRGIRIIDSDGNPLIISAESIFSGLFGKGPMQMTTQFSGYIAYVSMDEGATQIRNGSGNSGVLQIDSSGVSCGNGASGDVDLRMANGGTFTLHLNGGIVTTQ